MESQGNLISLIDNTDDIIVSRDRKGRAVVFNRAFKEIVRLLFGVEAEPGIRTADYLPEEQKKHWEEVLSKVLKNGDRHREEFGWEIDGETHYYEISINPIRVGDEILGTTEFMRDITEKKIKEKQLLIKQDELKKYTQQLEEMNTAFKVLIDYRKEESDDIKRSIIGKFKKIVIPYFPMSPETKTREELLTTMSILGNNINEILFSNNTSEIKLTDLSPTETRVAFMIKSGKTSKEIADSLNMSPRTVYFHRENLRKKLKLSRTKTNLKTYLQSTNT